MNNSGKPTANDLETSGPATKAKSSKAEFLAAVARANQVGKKNRIEKAPHVAKIEDSLKAQKYYQIDGIPHKKNAKGEWVPLTKLKKEEPTSNEEKI
jgi:hypothetical protein